MSKDHAAQFACPACGATLAFAPALGRMQCGYCGYEAAVEEATPPTEPATAAPARAESAADAIWGAAAPRDAEGLAELDYRAALRRSAEDATLESVRVVRCAECGAETEFAGAKAAGACPFCAAALVSGVEARRRFKAQGVLPFAIDEAAAREALRDWLGGLWFAPSDVASRTGFGVGVRAGRPLEGVYLPFWTFDADTRSTYDGQRGDAYTTHEWVTILQDGERRRARRPVRKIKWRPASGHTRRQFDDLLVLASRSLPDRLTRRLRGWSWDLFALRPYAPAYLAGFRAETYTVGLEDGYAEAQAEMARTIERDVRFDIGGDAQRVHRIDTRYDGVTFKHVLLPIWISVYRHRGKRYRYLVNGRTGAVVGERPYSTWKIALAVGVALALAGLAAFAFFAAQR